jgi:hypothetical protein
MNLKDLNLQELSVEEQVNVEGGWKVFSFTIFGFEIIGYDNDPKVGWTTDLW